MLRRSCRRKRPSRPLLRLPSSLFLAVSLVLFVVTSSAATAAAAATAGARGQTITKTGLGAPASDIITITSSNFKETVEFFKRFSWYLVYSIILCIVYRPGPRCTWYLILLYCKLGGLLYRILTLPLKNATFSLTKVTFPHKQRRYRARSNSKHRTNFEFSLLR